MDANRTSDPGVVIYNMLEQASGFPPWTSLPNYTIADAALLACKYRKQDVLMELQSMGYFIYTVYYKMSPAPLMKPPFLQLVGFYPLPTSFKDWTPLGPLLGWQRWLLSMQGFVYTNMWQTFTEWMKQEDPIPDYNSCTNVTPNTVSRWDITAPVQQRINTIPLLSGTTDLGDDYPFAYPAADTGTLGFGPPFNVFTWRIRTTLLP